MTPHYGQFVKRLLALAALAVLLVFGGCGFKNMPVPPSQVIPQAVTDLRYQLGEKGATLNWSYPNKTVSGDAISQITGFALYRAEVPADSYCPTCPIPFVEPISLPGGALPPGGSKAASYEVGVLRPGNLYFFKIRSKTGWWIESRDSNIVSFLWKSPPQAPDGLTAISGDGKNTLKWNPVNRLQDSTPMTEPALYQLYRGVDGGAFAKIGEPISATSYIDTGVENGKRYSYQVQSVNIYKQGTVISGGMSAPVNASPQDRTPPPTPGGVQGIRTDAGVKVFWDHVEAGDLAGYRVYRRAEGEAKPTLAGEVKLPYNMFLDQKAPQKGPLFYSVSSIDTQNPANESARSPEVTIAD